MTSVGSGANVLRMRDGIAIAAAFALAVGVVGCEQRKPAEPPIWEQVKIGDLAPSGPGNSSGGVIPSINFDVQVIEVPSERLGDLTGLWGMLEVKGVRLTSYAAFAGNEFQVRVGAAQMLGGVYEQVGKVGGVRVGSLSLLVPDGQTQDVPVAELPARVTVSFFKADDTKQTATLMQGVLVLRVKAQRVPELRGVCKLVAYPVFTVPVGGAVPELQARGKQREVIFDGAAVGLRMMPGQMAVLAPAGELLDPSVLGGLFFEQPTGRLFFDPEGRKPPAHKRAARIVILVCTGVPG